MNRFQLCLILTALSCAEPTATSSSSPPTAIVGRQQQNDSYSINAADRTVYVRLGDVRGESGASIHAFVQAMFESADSASARRLVIDLRSITGGDTRLLVPLIKGVAMRDRFVRGGGLYIVVGPNSFAPAQNAATLLQQYANPIFVH